MLEVRGEVTQHTPDFFKSDEGTEVYAELERFGRDLDAPRFGSTPGFAEWAV
jgi:hypothetical protein